MNWIFKEEVNHQVQICGRILDLQYADPEINTTSKAWKMSAYQKAEVSWICPTELNLRPYFLLVNIKALRLNRRGSTLLIKCTERWENQYMGQGITYLKTSKSLRFILTCAYRAFCRYLQRITNKCTKCLTLILDFKLSLCYECILSFGWLRGVWILCVDVSEHPVCAIFIGGVSRRRITGTRLLGYLYR